jgi:hypothetical protein
MSTLLESFEEHVKSRRPEDLGEDIALGLALTGIFCVLLFSLQVMF